jgi:hypothetical protein
VVEGRVGFEIGINSSDYALIAEVDFGVGSSTYVSDFDKSGTTSELPVTRLEFDRQNFFRACSVSR